MLTGGGDESGGRELIKGLSDIDLRNAALESLVGQVAELAPVHGRRLVRRVAQELDQQNLSDTGRIARIKVLLSSGKHGFEFVQRLVRARSERRHFEVHFSLFCFIDDLWHVDTDARLLEDYVRLVRDYLTSVPRDVARAAWMAGDLLGDHVPIHVSIQVLPHLLTDARYAAGRLAALHGCELALQRTAGRSRALLENALRKAARGDRSLRVREQAARILRKCQTVK